MLDIPEGDAAHVKQIVRVEEAKSDRSKCRKCQEMIEKGETRFGLEAWMAGRVLVGWLKHDCFKSGLKFDVAQNGRAKCKQSGEAFKKGEVRFAVNSYLKTYVKLSCVDEVMRKAAAEMGGEFSLEEVEGYEELDAKQREEVASHIPSFPRLAGQPPAPEGTKDNDKASKKRAAGKASEAGAASSKRKKKRSA